MNIYSRYYKIRYKKGTYIGKKKIISHHVVYNILIEMN